MYSLKQSRFAKGAAGEPLPTVWPVLAEKGTKFIRGQLVLIAAGPGVGKSALALTLALKAKVPTVYFSADSDAQIQLSRAISILGNLPYREAWERARTGDLEGIPGLDEAMIRFDYNASPTVEKIDAKLQAYVEVFEEYPELIIIDNITNVRRDGDSDDPFNGLESLMDELHNLARSTGACVVGLHHVTGGYNDADKPVPLSGIKGQIARVPEMVLTLHRTESNFGSDQLHVSTVKNRSGRANPSGNDPVSLYFNADRMQIK